MDIENARVEPPVSSCLVCDQPVLPEDEVTMVGTDLLHARCLEHPKAIGGVAALG